MTKKAETMTIRINTSTLAALDIVAAEYRVRTGKSLSMSDTIWALIENAAPHVAARVELIEKEAEAQNPTKPASKTSKDK